MAGTDLIRARYTSLLTPWRDEAMAKTQSKKKWSAEVTEQSDIQTIDVILVPETDDGATGIRVRDLPIRLDKLLSE
jgi:hypothetical protein